MNTPNNCATAPGPTLTGAGTHTNGAPLGPSLPASRSCQRLRTATFKLHHTRYGSITKVRVYVGNRLLLVRRGRHLRTVKVGLSQSGSQRIRIVTYDRRGLARRSTRTVNACAKTRPRTKSRHKRAP